MDDCAQMGRETVRKYLQQLWTDMRIIYGDNFLNRRPTVAELGMIKQKYAAQGFSGYVGSVDCTKLRWKNFRYSMKGQYNILQDGHLETLHAEAWIDKYLYAWN